MLRTIIVVSITFLYIFLTGIPGLIIAFVTRSSRVLYIAGRGGAKLALLLGGMRVTIRGREKIDTSRPCVYVPNHESIVDSVVVFDAMPHDSAALGKKEFFRLPVLGQACLMAGFIPVDRQDPEQRIQAVNEAVRWIVERGKSYLVYGEGTRSRDGRLGPFKKGAAIMAIQSQVDIIPVAIYGGFALWPKGRWFFTPGHIQIDFLDPLSTQGMTMEDRDRVTQECRSRIAERLEEMRQGGTRAAAKR